jgi:hypothetical protein
MLVLSLEGAASSPSLPHTCKRRSPCPYAATSSHPHFRPTEKTLIRFFPFSELCVSASNYPSFSACKSHRITSFADPHHLTLIESYSCKKHGRGWGRPRSSSQPNPFPLFPRLVNIQRIRTPVYPAQREGQPHSSHAFTSRFSGYRGYPFKPRILPQQVAASTRQGFSLLTILYSLCALHFFIIGNKLGSAGGESAMASNSGYCTRKGSGTFTLERFKMLISCSALTTPLP